MSLSAFIPRDRLNALAQHQELPSRSKGIILFADISGFTALTEQLVKELGSARGCEVLSQCLNSVYNSLIAVVHNYRGSVISFAGDSITCWFAPEEGAVLRAVTAAFEMQGVMEQQANIDTFGGKLAIKIAVGAGIAHRFTLGDPAIQRMELIAGAAVNAVLQAESVAKRGEILLTTEVYNSLKENLIINGWRDDPKHGNTFAIATQLKNRADHYLWPVLPVETLAEAELQPWVLASIYERMNMNMGDFLTELRPAVALFLRFDGLDYEADSEAGYKLNAYICWVQNLISKYRGTLLQISLEHKGSYLYAAFGAPVSYQNDVEGALRAALALQKVPDEFSWITNVQIGLTHGKMRTGVYGSPERHTYGVLGDDVNLAARLMQAGKPGQILATTNIQKLVGDSLFGWDDLPPIQVKGKDNLIAICELIKTSNPTLKVPPTTKSALIGRRNELEFIRNKLDLPELSRGGGLVIEGEPGIGKSHLLSHVVSEAREAGVIVLTGNTDALEQNEAFYIWHSVFNQLLGLDPQDSPETRRLQVQQKLELLLPEFAELAPLLNSVLYLNYPENERTAQMSGQIRADNTLELLLALLQASVSTRGLLIVLEDAHWLDSASRTLSLLILQRLPTIFLLVSTRPPNESSALEYSEKLKEAGATQLVLKGLESEEIIQLLYQRLDVNTLPPAVIELVSRKAQGNPFFSEELAYTLRDRGVITLENNQCVITRDNSKNGLNLETLDLPDTVQGVITNRIDILTPYQQSILKTASVIGRNFKFQLLYDIYPLAKSESRLQYCLEDLSQLDITVLESPLPDLAYLFKHIITQEVVYNLMPFEQRRQLHKLVAQWLENRFANNLVPYYSLLAYHWEHTEITSKTIEYLDKAGEQAIKNGIYPEAVTFYTRLLHQLNSKNVGEKALPGIESREAYWLKQLGTAYVGCGNLQEGRKHLEQALKLTGFNIPSIKSVVLLKTVQQLVKQVVSQTGLVKPGLKMGTELERYSLAVEILLPLQQIYLFSGASLPLMYSVALRSNLVEHIGLPRYLAESYISLCMGTSSIGLYGVAEKYKHKAEEKAAEVNDLAIQGQLASCQATYYIGLGRFGDSEKAARQAVGYYERLGDKRELGINACVVALSLLHQGKYKQCVQLYSQIYETALKTGNIQIQIWSKFGVIQALTLGGKIESAKAELVEATPLLDQIPSEIERSSCYSTLALLYLYQGDYQQAQHYAQLLAHIMGKLVGRTFGFISGYCAVLEVGLTLYALDQQKYQNLLKTTRPVARKLKSFGKAYPVGAIYSLFYQGRYEAVVGNTNKARQYWLKALAISEKLKLTYEQALLHQQLAKDLTPKQHDYTEHLDKSKHFFSILEGEDTIIIEGG